MWFGLARDTSIMCLMAVKGDKGGRLVHLIGATWLPGKVSLAGLAAAAHASDCSQANKAVVTNR